MKIFKTRDVKTPNRGSAGSAGIDLFVPNGSIPVKKGDLYDLRDDVAIAPGKSVLIASGIKANIPEGHALIAFNKSGVAVKHNLLVGACVIDEDYTGEIHIDLKNVGEDVVIIEPGDKLIQLLCLPINYVPVEEVDSEEECFGSKLEESERGAGGFGSTGTK